MYTVLYTRKPWRAAVRKRNVVENLAPGFPKVRFHDPSHRSATNVSVRFLRLLHGRAGVNSFLASMVRRAFGSASSTGIARAIPLAIGQPANVDVGEIIV